MWYLVLLGQAVPSHRYLTESQRVEIMWTVVPCIVLISIALPRLRLLYTLDDVGRPCLTVKSVGHQWYWSYEYSDLGVGECDAYMAPSTMRLMDCDHRLLLPSDTPVRILVTAADVLHS